MGTLKQDDDECAEQSCEEGITALERCRKPVIGAFHSGVIGAGVDLASACDIRYCSEDAWFQIAEVNVGLAADVGTLQRLPKIVGNDSVVRELAFTGRKMASAEAKELGLVGKIFATREDCLAAARKLAQDDRTIYWMDQLEYTTVIG
eukprot:s1734_g8.t1